MKLQPQACKQTKILHMKLGLKMLLETGNQDGIYPNNNNIINIDKEKNNTYRCLAKKQGRVILALLKRKLKQGGSKFVKPGLKSLFQSI